LITKLGMKASTAQCITVTSLLANHGAVLFWILGLLAFNEWRFSDWHNGDYYYLVAALCWGISNIVLTYEYLAAGKKEEEGVKAVELNERH